MHFALPTRGNSRSSPFLTTSAPRSYIPPALRRRPIYGVLLFIVMALLLLKSWGGDRRPADGPHTVLVLVLNRTDHSTEHISRIIENREEYAKAHGYELFTKNVEDYPGGGAASTWARIPALRHAMATFPKSEWFWYLDQDALIMNPALSIEDHILQPLASLIRRNVPIVPPDSIIKTYKHVPAERMQFILSQDKGGLLPGSMIMKSGAWANYFLDAWYDPMFRFYNFAKGEKHALEHIVQWHPTILTKLALIPQKQVFSSAIGEQDGSYSDGDFVVHFDECWNPERECEKAFNKFWQQRRRALPAATTSATA